MEEIAGKGEIATIGIAIVLAIIATIARFIFDNEKLHNGLYIPQ